MHSLYNECMKNKKPIYFITGNQSKVLEAEGILGIPIRIQKLDLQEIQDLEVEVIARVKAEEAFKVIKEPLFVDDTSLIIEAWDKFPGPFIKYIMVSGGPELLLRMMSSEKNRRAVAKITIAYHDGKRVHLFTNSKKGSIANSPKGRHGFDWDRMFIPKPFNKTYAHMSLAEKNRISHRKLALLRFKKFLED